MDNITKDTPFHEVGHAYLKKMKDSNPALYAKGEKLARESKTYKELKNNDHYAKYDDGKFLEEVMATDIGLKGAEIFNDRRDATRWDNFVKKARGFVAKALNMSPQAFEKMTYGEFVEGAASDVTTGGKDSKFNKNTKSDSKPKSTPKSKPDSKPDSKLDEDISNLSAQSTDDSWYKSPKKWIGAILPPSADDYHGLASKIKSILPGIDGLTKAFTDNHEKYVDASTKVREAVKKLNDGIKLKLGNDYTGTIAGVRVSNYQAMQAIAKGPDSLKGKISDSEIAALKKFAASNGVQSYVDRMKDLGVLKPDGNITNANPANDLVTYITNDLYKESFKEFNAAKDKLVTPRAKAEIGKKHGDKFLKAFENSLQRMSSGKAGGGPTTKTGQAWQNFMQGSIGVTMFFNFRSAALQTLSILNYVAESSNPMGVMRNMMNPSTFKEARALFNSSYLKERRARAGFDVNASEMMTAARNGKLGDFQKKLLNKGFIATSVVDSIAIAFGGAAFIKTEVDAGVPRKEAIKKWKEQTEASQQSSRPDRVSQMQTEGISKYILAFANTPQQYFRLAQKATREIKAGKDVKKNMAKIGYYMVAQNALFTGLQSASMALLGGMSGNDEEDKKALEAYNSMSSTILRGMGLIGATIDTSKNVILEAVKQEGKANPDHVNTALKALSISPPINRKMQDLLAIGRAHNYDNENKWTTTAARGGAFANIPTDWVHKKGKAAFELLDDNYSKWEAFLLAAGWSEYNFEKKDKGFDDIKFDDISFEDTDFEDSDIDFSN